MLHVTHSTIVASLTRIRRERLLPTGGEVTAKMGQEVSPVQVVARTPQQMEFHILPLTDILNLTSQELARRLLVKRNDVIEQGTPLVAKKGFGSKEFLSPVDGMVHDIRNGRLIVQQSSGWIELRALAQGRVVNQVPNLGVILEIQGSRIQAIWDSGQEGFGTLNVVADSPDTVFNNEQLGSDSPGKVVVAGKLIHRETLDKAELTGISGLIAGSITADLAQVAGHFSYPIFITDGIGDQGMSTPIYQLFQQSEARDVALFSSPPNPWGNRSEIVIPLAASPGEEAPAAGRPLAIGQRVRILRLPHTGQIGEVVRLYSRVRFTPVGSKARGADVRLPDGQIVFVPDANLDAIV